MSTASAPQAQPIGRGRVLAIGLSVDELQLLRRVARSAWAITVSGDATPSSRSVPHGDLVVSVVSAGWLLHALGLPGTETTLSTWHGVALVPVLLPPAHQRALARGAPHAHLVLTGQSGTIDALHEALPAVVHDVCVRDIAAVLGEVHDTFITRVVRAAITLPPHRASVPALAGQLHQGERTLRRRLAEYAPNFEPQRLLAWARLLHIASRLRDPSCTLARAIVGLRMSGGGNAGRTLRQLAGMTFSDLRGAESANPVITLLERMRIVLRKG